jgi:hypothetical protein
MFARNKVEEEFKPLYERWGPLIPQCHHHLVSTLQFLWSSAHALHDNLGDVQVEQTLSSQACCQL